jgi:hypothetical protein
LGSSSTDASDVSLNILSVGATSCSAVNGTYAISLFFNLTWA